MLLELLKLIEKRTQKRDIAGTIGRASAMHLGRSFIHVVIRGRGSGSLDRSGNIVTRHHVKITRENNNVVQGSTSSMSKVVRDFGRESTDLASGQGEIVDIVIHRGDIGRTND